MNTSLLPSKRRRVLQRTYSTRFNDFALKFYSFVADNYAPVVRVYFDTNLVGTLPPRTRQQLQSRCFRQSMTTGQNTSRFHGRRCCNYYNCGSYRDRRNSFRRPPLRGIVHPYTRPCEESTDRWTRFPLAVARSGSRRHPLVLPREPAMPAPQAPPSVPPRLVVSWCSLPYPTSVGLDFTPAPLRGARHCTVRVVAHHQRHPTRGQRRRLVVVIHVVRELLAPNRRLFHEFQARIFRRTETRDPLHWRRRGGRCR